MKLQPESKKQLAYIAGGTLLLTVAMLVIFEALSLPGLVHFGWPVVLGGIGGTAVAVGNFYALCLTVQKVAAQPDGARRGLIKLSYNVRLLVQAVWCILAYALPCFHVVAAVVPLLFPRMVIYYMQITGRFRQDDAAHPAAPEISDAAGPSEPEVLSPGKKER